MIALAAATILTALALAIWTGEHPVSIDWTGPLTADHTTCHQHDPILNTWCAQPAHHTGPHDDTLGCIWDPHGARYHHQDDEDEWIDITPHVIGDPVITPGPPSRATTRALRASERHDHRKENR